MTAMIKSYNVVLVWALTFAAGVIGADDDDDDPVNLYFDVDAYWHDGRPANDDDALPAPVPSYGGIQHSVPSSHYGHSVPSFHFGDVQHSVPASFHYGDIQDSVPSFPYGDIHHSIPSHYGDVQNSGSSSHHGDIQDSVHSFRYSSVQSGEIDASSSVHVEGDAFNDACEKASPSLSADFDQVLLSFFESASAQNHADHTSTGRGPWRSQIHTSPMDLSASNAFGADIDGVHQSTALLAPESPPTHCEHALPALADHYGRHHAEASSSHVMVHSMWQHAQNQIGAAESWSSGQFLGMPPQPPLVDTGLDRWQQGSDVGIELSTQAAAADPASLNYVMEGCSGAGNANTAAVGEPDWISSRSVTRVEGAASPAENFAHAAVDRDVGLLGCSILASGPGVGHSAGRSKRARQSRQLRKPTGGAGSSAVRPPSHMPSSGEAVRGLFCGRCHLELNCQHAVYRHMEHWCPNRFDDPRYGCPFCDKTFTCPDTVALHGGKEHESLIPTPRRCPIAECGEMFDKFRVLRQHVGQGHRGTSFHPCPYCIDVFTSSAALDNHVSESHSHYRRFVAGGTSEGASF
ncbi:Uncharacterized protein PBTT_05056 [Plasmodiophora brassicae]